MAAAVAVLTCRRSTNSIIISRIRSSADPRIFPACHYAIKKIGTTKITKLGPVAEKKKLPVVTDPEKLVNYLCGSNLLKEGEDLKLKDDSEYPDWLWKLNLGKPPTLEEMDPETLEYWKTLHKLKLNRYNRLHKGKRFLWPPIKL